MATAPSHHDIEQVGLELEQAVSAAMSKRLEGESADQEIRLVSSLTVRRVGLVHEALEASDSAA